MKDLSTLEYLYNFRYWSPSEDRGSADSCKVRGSQSGQAADEITWRHVLVEESLVLLVRTPS